jgi:hypothetical protein
MGDVSQLQSIVNDVSIALLGAIRPQLRAVEVRFDENEKTIFFLAYFDGEISGDDESKISSSFNYASKYILRSLGTPYIVQKQIFRWDTPKKLPQDGLYVYVRDETPFFEKNDMTWASNFDDEINEMTQLRFVSIYALLGRARQNLRHFYTTINERKYILYFWFYFDGEISAADREIATRISNDVIAFFRSKHDRRYQGELHIDRYDFPQEIPNIGASPIYMRDESILGQEEQEVDVTENEDQKLWHNLESGKELAFSWRTPFTSDEFYYIARLALLDRIKSSWRAIQFAIDHLHRTIHLRFYVDGEISKEDQDLTNSISQDFSLCQYNIEKEIQKSEASLPLPHSECYLYRRYESPSHIFNSDTLLQRMKTDIDRSWNSPDTHIKSRLRDVQIAVNDIEKKFNIVFFFADSFCEEDIKKAHGVIGRVSEYLPDYTGENYIARYDFPESIPGIGASIYPKRDQKQEFRDIFLQNASRALIGKIPASLRAIEVLVDIVKKIFYFWFYFDGEISSDSRLLLHDITRFTSTWPDFACTTEVVALDRSEQIPSIGMPLFSRYESKFTS